MILNIKLRTVVIVSITLVAIFISTNAYVIAQDDGIGERSVMQGKLNPDTALADPVPGGPGFLSISATTFAPSMLGPVPFYSFGYNHELYTNTIGISSPAAPIFIPNGVYITRFIIYFYTDFNSEVVLTANLIQKTLSGYPEQNMASVSSISYVDPYGYGYGIDQSIDYALIDQQNCAYLVEVFFPSNLGEGLRLVGVRIDYSNPSYLPVIMK